MTKKQKRSLFYILIAGALFIPGLLLRLEKPYGLLVFLVPYLLVGHGVLRKAAQNLFHGQLLDENFLMAIASLGAFVLGEYAEAVGVMLFYQVGELFESCAVERSRRSIAALTDICPDTAVVIRNGQSETVSPEEVEVGELIEIRPGERIPVDARIREGSSDLDTAALTGETMPLSVQPGDEILSGCINRTGLLVAEVTKPASQSAAARILELVEDAVEKKARSEDFITRFARVYTPAVVIAALLLGLIPSLFTGEWGIWIHRALLFLVISCPCALVISVPLSFFGGIGGASSRGILVKGGSYFELLSKVDTVVFDKTGTLTRGRFSLSGVYPAEGISEKRLLETVAAAEHFSLHPIARSLAEKLPDSFDLSRLHEVTEHRGLGVTALLDGKPVAVGNAALMETLSLSVPVPTEDGTVVYAAGDGQYLGYALLADEIKPTAEETVSALRSMGIHTVMLTGDGEAAAKRVADALGLDELYARLMPEDKLRCMEELFRQKTGGGRLAYVGDGINDAPVLTRADIGIAMGALGSDAAIEAADVVIMDDDPKKLLTAIALSRKCVRIVRENIIFALCSKGIFLLLGALGLAGMWAAVFADVGVAILAILNALRMLIPKKR